jgi:FtsZ-binding cell division protein ZapB
MATIQEKIKLLEKEIDTLQEQIAALKQEAPNNMTESEKMQEELEPIPFNTFT